MPDRPNILFLLSDQHSPHAMSCAEHPVIRTPHMDRLAQEGLRFSSAYCATPLCFPSRVALLTGRFGHNTGVMFNNQHLRGPEPTFPDALREVGYHTCAIGKMHFGQGVPPGSPHFAARLSELGFDEAIGGHGKWSAGRPGNDDGYKSYLNQKGLFEKLSEDYVARHQRAYPYMYGEPDRAGEHWHAAPSPLSETDFHDAYIGRITADWLRSYEAEEPFFCWCNWGGPHDPWDPPGRYATMYDPEAVDPPLKDPMERAPEMLWEKRRATMTPMPPDAWRTVRAAYYGLINVIDDAIGEILSALKESGRLENTVVIYASDHGEMLYDHGLVYKSVMYEASAGVPLLVRLPQSLQKQTVIETPVSLLDLIPTYLDLADAPEMNGLHGRSLTPLLAGETDSPETPVCSEMGPMKMIRSGPYKYVYHPEWELQQLFNIADDPDELNNLAALPEFGNIERDMQNQLLGWMINTESQPLK